MVATGPGGYTQVADSHVLQQWRTGPRWYHVVVASITDPRLEQRRCSTAAVLADLVEVSTPGQPHVTVWAAGFDVAPRLPRTRQLTVTVRGPATFASALYLTVESPTIAALRTELAALNPPEDRSGVYTPHVTVGLYQRRFPLTAVQQRIVSLGEYPPLRLPALVEHLVVDTRTDRLHPAPA